ncbi:MAG: glycosyltransferase, partial [Gemmataceae bacterium]
MQPLFTVLIFATQGSGGNEEQRLRDLTAALNPTLFPFDRSAKRRSFWTLLRQIRVTRPDLVIMEGSGLAGGFALILGRWLYRVPYVVSSGDAVGPWVGSKFALLGPIFTLYEKLLCRWAAGFIGWTPYLAGRAMTFGCPRATTAPGWAPFAPPPDPAAARKEVRTALGIAPEATVVGIAGALVWSRRRQYCYGLELVEAARHWTRPDAIALIIGDGSGMA